MPRQHCTNFPDIAQEKSRANIEQKDKIGQNITKLPVLSVFMAVFFSYTLKLLGPQHIREAQDQSRSD